jgi:hypothetical protein
VESDRPIYFIETRNEYVCSLYDIVSGRLISIPHPLSPCCARVFTYPSEAEVIGLVIGVVARADTARTGNQRRTTRDNR